MSTDGPTDDRGARELSSFEQLLVDLTLAEERAALTIGTVEALDRILAAINLRAGLLRLVVEGEPLSDDVAHLERLARAGLASIRRTETALTALGHTPSAVDDALRRLAADFETRHPTRVVVHVADVGDIDAAVRDALVRCAHEALSNVERHAEARHVDLEVSLAGSEVVLRVRDDGLGRSGQSTAQWRGPAGLDLAARLIEAVGGSLEVRDADPGVEVVARVPRRRVTVDEDA